jgi:hypothetical protein
MTASKKPKLIIPKAIRITDDERRKSIRQMTHKRFKAVLKSKNPEIGFPGEVIANVIDVSVGGVGVCTNTHLGAGIDLTIEIITPKENFNFDAKVMWTAALPKSGKVIKQTQENEMQWQAGLLLIESESSPKQKMESLYEAAI